MTDFASQKTLEPPREMNNQRAMEDVMHHSMIPYTA